MTSVPPDKVAKILPHPAVHLLQAAAVTRNATTINKAIATCKMMYPSYFRKEQQK